MRSNELYLSDNVQAADSIAQFVADMDEEQFVGDDLVRSAVLHKLAVIGEAAARVSSELRESYPGRTKGPPISRPVSSVQTKLSRQ